jgi:hypothetical protein
LVPREVSLEALAETKQGCVGLSIFQVWGYDGQATKIQVASRAKSGPSGELQPRLHREAMQEIVDRAADNDWFEYPVGSQLHYFRFPECYCLQAQYGVSVFFKDSGPTLMRQQPPLLGPSKRNVLKSKILKFIMKGYIVPPEPGQVKSLIKYFAVPKGVLDGVIQDWRVVSHAGANKLNDLVWAPVVCPALAQLTPTNC